MTDSDKSMIDSYNKIQIDLSKLNLEIANLKKYLTKVQSEEDAEKLKYIFDDIWHILNSFTMLDVCCKSRANLRNSFFNITTFTRSNIETAFIILSKFDQILENNNSMPNINELKSEIDNIYRNLHIKKELRNKLEHAIDPYFDGRLFEIQDNYVLRKQFEFAESATCFCKAMIENGLTFRTTELLLNHTVMSVEERKKQMCSNYKVVEISRYFSEFSYRSERNLSSMKRFCNENMGIFGKDLMREKLKSMVTPPEEKNIADLCLKAIEFNMAMAYTYKDIPIKGETVYGSSHAYFCRIAITKCYQICDKLGYNLSAFSNHNFSNSYFKKVSQILSSCDRPLNTLEEKMVNFNNSTEYLLLSKIRNHLVHKNKMVDFQNNEAIINSALTSAYGKLSEMVLDITTMYVTNNKIELSQESYNEMIEKTIIIPI